MLTNKCYKVDKTAFRHVIKKYLSEELANKFLSDLVEYKVFEEVENEDERQYEFKVGDIVEYYISLIR